MQMVMVVLSKRLFKYDVDNLRVRCGRNGDASRVCCSLGKVVVVVVVLTLIGSSQGLTVTRRHTDANAFNLSMAFARTFGSAVSVIVPSPFLQQTRWRH